MQNKWNPRVRGRKKTHVIPFFPVLFVECMTRKAKGSKRGGGMRNKALTHTQENVDVNKTVKMRTKKNEIKVMQISIHSTDVFNASYR